MQTLSTHKPSSCKCFSEALVPLHNVKPSQEACRGLAEKFLILGSEGHTLILWQREQRLSKTTGRVHAQELEVCHSINATRRSRISEVVELRIPGSASPSCSAPPHACSAGRHSIALSADASPKAARQKGLPPSPG